MFGMNHATLFGISLPCSNRLLAAFFFENADFLRMDQKWLIDQGLVGNAYLVGIDIVFIIFCFPGSFLLELYCGFAYGLVKGSITILLGKNIAAGICFVLGRTLLADWVRSMVKSSSNFRSFYAASGSSGWQLVLAGRLSPVPSYVCNYGFSATSVSIEAYAIATLLASIPMVVQNVYLGSLAQGIEQIMSSTPTKTSSPLEMLFKYGFPLIGTLLIVIWLKSFLTKLVDDAETGKMAGSEYSESSAPLGSSNSAILSPRKKSLGSGRSKSPAPRKASAGRPKSPAPRKTPAKASAKGASRSPSPAKVRRTPRKA